MKTLNPVLALVAAFALVNSVALAGGDDKKTCDKSKSSCSSESSIALKNCMPKMVATVGDEEFDCPKTACEVAKKSGKSVVFTVAGKKYDCPEKAMTAYADVMDDFVVKFASVRTKDECMTACSAGSAKSSGCCSSGSKAKKTGTSTEVAAKDSAKGECPFSKSEAKGETKTVKADAKKAPVVYCVATQNFDCKDKAEQAAKTAQAAMKTVAMKYRVGDKDFCCDKMAGDECKKAGKDAKMVFVVGTTKTECKVMARIELAKAKIQAAVKALENNGKVASKV